MTTTHRPSTRHRPLHVSLWRASRDRGGWYSCSESVASAGVPEPAPSDPRSIYCKELAFLPCATSASVTDATWPIGIGCRKRLRPIGVVPRSPPMQFSLRKLWNQILTAHSISIVCHVAVAPSVCGVTSWFIHDLKQLVSYRIKGERGFG